MGDLFAAFDRDKKPQFYTVAPTKIKKTEIFTDYDSKELTNTVNSFLSNKEAGNIQMHYQVTVVDTPVGKRPMYSILVTYQEYEK